MPISKDMAAPTSRWMEIRRGFEGAYNLYPKEKFLDFTTTAFLLKEVDEEIKIKELKRIGL